MAYAASPDGPPGPPPAALVEICDVWKIFGGVPVLRGVNLTLRAGEIHALLGGNGAGKSTLMKVLAGLYRPERGEVRLLGTLLGQASPAAVHRLGAYLVPQEPLLFPNLSVLENVTLRLPREADQRSRLEKLMNLLELELDLRLPARYLDVAQQQLVEILRGLMRRARVLILDEPTSSLTPKETQLLFGRLRRLTQDGVGIFFISHKLHEIRELCDAISVLRDGEIVLRGRPEDFTDAGIVRAMTNEDPGQSSREVNRQVGTQAALQVVEYAGEGFGPLTFDLHAGEVLGIAGVIGSGRTELAETIVGLRQPDQGQVRMGEQTLRPGSHRAALDAGVVYLTEDRQHQGLFLDTSIAWNTSSAVLHREGWLLDAGRVHRQARQMIEELAIRCQGPGQELRQLSGGNQQKALIAKCLACEPRVLILDEPTRGVDVLARNEIYAIIDALAARGVAVLLISSDFEEVARLSDRALIMRQGLITGELHGEQLTPEAIAGRCFERRPVPV
ncbi:autoinducer 2 ABC transporter ATP-binding protein LsrA (plasmid) [Deinococcus metallilatus]|uniref:Autoinducer 2 import ATP-binding protein LsrA n=2 Tax=Deinococcus metallilatus TaxID=1211322 RepID=A0AAJ5JZW8_9DEIO|nr:autoinducer 2 ABC transporter ATP-binding protein LsrA [Deinococcus metallilatus]MBB5293497.1 AI-2 transport system ATP-binding protein [Deinococcus metallilatus]QBY06578.1 autoinducer 2 ABC transporter ATP-binding protein LsrA [Deinococcus metallilatus]RXJ17921.1 autoinducer 2 ABC transporter ATP-binding protein LsrA [Deinococcus metallilatus]TLK32365.1 autoinducer 2 ABC transporter ATP-binding protein LsrA [Deinococcus metallilatus]GMA15283.1 sugar ABC transporter ATP-binding protein [Dei